MISVFRDEYGPCFVEEIVLLVYISRELQAPGPGIFSVSGCGGFIFPLSEYEILLDFFRGSYAPGPGFLLLIVSARGPVVVISALPYPKQKPFFNFYGEENSLGRL